jgi:hypothetical protein
MVAKTGLMITHCCSKPLRDHLKKASEIYTNFFKRNVGNRTAAANGFFPEIWLRRKTAKMDKNLY